MNLSTTEELELTYYCDTKTHLVCTPYSIENLHEMARRLGLGRHWFDNRKSKKHPHYDIPLKRYDEISRLCIKVTQRELLQIIKNNPA